MADADITRRPEIVPAAEAQPRLAKAWDSPSGLLASLATVDHKEIGKRYLITAFAFLIAGGIEALIMRLQLAQPGNDLLSPEAYNQLFTMHGMTMIFLYALPILSGFSNYLWPLMLGARDMAFPRVNALSYWLFLLAGLFMYSAFPSGNAPNVGWFNYVPLAGGDFNPGLNIDVYALGMVFLGISTTVGSANFIVTAFRTRAPGMAIHRMPIFIWGTLTASVGNLFAVPAVSLTFLMLWLDRNLDMHFFDAAEGGSPVLWQHLFWMFGHPWVYAIVLPAMGIISQTLPAFCRRRLVGFNLVVLSTILTMVVGFGVWVHHMFAIGMATIPMSFFAAASMAIIIPSAVAVFAWLATIWKGTPVFTTPMLFGAGFVFLFVVGGVSGFMTAVVPLDWQLTDTYFVVAHIHYVLIGINVFPVVAGIYYWFPKMTGKMMSERLGRWNFWVMFLGFNIGFFPMHISGLLGMPRRVYTYPSGLGWDALNMLTTLGAFLFAVGVLLFVVNVLISAKRGKPAGNNPWDASTLEWSTTSPPPEYNFAVIPTVATRDPLWEDRLLATGRRSQIDHGLLLDQGHETIGTTGIDAQPDVVYRMPAYAYTPLILAGFLTLLFMGLLLHLWWVAVAGALGCIGTLFAWLMPRASLAQTEPRKRSENQGSRHGA